MKELTKYYVYIISEGVVYYCTAAYEMTEQIDEMTIFNHEKSAKSRVSLWKNVLDKGGWLHKVGDYDEINYKEFKYFVPEPGIDF